MKAFGQLAAAPNQKVLMLPMEATSMLGSLGGIGEIARATFGEEYSAATALHGGAGARCRGAPLRPIAGIG